MCTISIDKQQQKQKQEAVAGERRDALEAFDLTIANADVTYLRCFKTHACLYKLREYLCNFPTLYQGWGPRGLASTSMTKLCNSLGLGLLS